MPPLKFRKHFQLDEAQAWIPRLRRLFGQVRSTLADVREEVEAIKSQRYRLGGNGGGIDATRYFSGDQRLNEILAEIQEAGIVIQDVSRGLEDFPYILDGEEVLVCWQLDDEDELLWYHDLSSGFAGRTRLPD